jgi:L-fuculose-phosphate aldolase
MNEELRRAQAHIAEIGTLLFQRQLTDAAGGNISVRVGDRLAMSPRYAGMNYHWRLKPEDVLIVDLDGNVLEGSGQISREAKVHLALHREFGEHGQAVIHCHARNVLVFAAMNRPLPPVLEATLKFGEIPVAEFAPSHTPQLSEHIAAVIRGQEARIRKHAAAAIAPWHGLFVMAKDLDAAFDAAERIDTNAYCLLMGEMMAASDLLAAQRSALQQGAAAYGEE